MFQEVVIKEEGYVYIYVSNENPTLVDAWFDDFTVTHEKTPIIQKDDYYPFGLSFNSWQRGGSKKNDYLFNGKERQDELDIGWMDYGARIACPEERSESGYDGSVGRWHVVDPLSELTFGYSPYTYAFDNPVYFIDPTGMANAGFQEDEWMPSYVGEEKPEENIMSQMMREARSRSGLIAKCPSCPSSPEYDDYRNSENMYFNYDGETGIVYNAASPDEGMMVYTGYPPFYGAKHPNDKSNLVLPNLFITGTGGDDSDLPSARSGGRNIHHDYNEFLLEPFELALRGNTLWKDRFAPPSDAKIAQNIVEIGVEADMEKRRNKPKIGQIRALRSDQRYDLPIGGSYEYEKDGYIIKFRVKSDTTFVIIDVKTN